LMKDKLYLARLDRFHWESDGYELMAKQCATFILKELDRNNESNPIKF